MLLKKISHFLRTTSFRLTVWYALIFAISSVTAYVVAYYTVKADLNDRFDAELVEDLEELVELYEEGIEEIAEEIEDEEEDEGIERVFLRLISPDLEALVSTDMRHWEVIHTLTPSLVKDLKDEPRIRAISTPEHKYGARVACLRMSDGNIFQIGFLYTEEGRLLENFTKVFSFVIPGMILGGCLIGLFMARRAMSGVRRVTESAISISQGDLSSRVPIGKEGTEIENLAVAFNEMIKRIQRLIKELSEVTDNVAHDLRSPITRMRLIAETTLSGSQDIKEYRKMASVIIEECDRQVEMIRTMLDMAAMDAGITSFRMGEVNISELLDDAAELFLPLAQNKNIDLAVKSDVISLIVKGNKSLLQRVISNLLDNAIKYTPSNGNVRLNASESRTNVNVSINDSGSGIPKEDLPHIFKPFYRADKSRSTQGNGLGLSLARSIILAHSGTISVESSSENGSTFTVLLPKPA